MPLDIENAGGERQRSQSGYRWYLTDLQSTNGTFVRINGQSPIGPGDLLLVGEQILRVDPA